MGTIASQITSLTIVFSTAYSDADQRKHQSSASLAFVRGIHRGPVNSSHKCPVTRKVFPFDDVIMTYKGWSIPPYPLPYRWIGSRYSTPVIDNVENVQTEITYFDGTYSLVITRDVRTGDSQDLDLDKDLYMMFPVGGGPISVARASAPIGRHTMTPSLSDAPVNLYESLMGTMRTTPSGNLCPGGRKI